MIHGRGNFGRIRPEAGLIEQTAHRILNILIEKCGKPAMGYAVLKQFNQIKSYVGEVSALADRNKEAFGFTPLSAYEEMAAKGQLWIATNATNELKGYLIFGGTMPTLKVFQIYTCPSVKGDGLGAGI